MVTVFMLDKVEPYKARSTTPKSSSSTLFNDYGRLISVPSGKTTPVNSNKIVRVVPKADTQEDAKSEVQKFWVKLLADSGGQNTMDVLCQIGLDDICMLDLATSRTLRIYPLYAVTGCDKTDSSTSAFGQRALWILSQGVLDCSQIVTVPTPFGYNDCCNCTVFRSPIRQLQNARPVG